MNSAQEPENRPVPAMQRLALESIQPGMTLARDIYDEDGTIMVSAGTVLTDRLLSRLRNWEIRSAFIQNPRVTLPEVSAALQEKVRNQARLMVEHAFGKIRRAEQFSMSNEEQKTVHAVVEEATQDPQAVIHMAHIQRNSRDILSHSVNVALLATATALAMGIGSANSLQELALAALLHDIGLLMIPQDLLARKGNLKPEEAAIYREHANWGQLILQQSALPESVSRVAREHHENADGTGFPNQLSADAMHPFSRIVAAVNAYENFCASIAESHGSRAYLAYESVMAGAGTLFDLKVAKALLARLPMYPAGSLVELTNGLIGVVVSASQAMPHRPCLKILAQSDETPIEEPFMLDLADLEHQTTFVKDVLNDERTARIMTATK
jgi:putative nucleotidyltransferase with HDIG domain